MEAREPRNQYTGRFRVTGNYRSAAVARSTAVAATKLFKNRINEEAGQVPINILDQVQTDEPKIVPSSNESNNKSKLVQMRFQPRTVESIEELSKLTRIDNKTQLVSSAVQLTAELLSSLKQGAKIYIEQPNGQKELLKFVGFLESDMPPEPITDWGEEPEESTGTTTRKELFHTLRINADDVRPHDVFKLAKWILGVIAVLLVAASIGRISLDSEGMKEVWEYAKVLLGPIISLILGLYFGQRARLS